MNSLRSIEDTLYYEIRRQAALLAAGGKCIRRPVTGTRRATPLQGAP